MFSLKEEVKLTKLIVSIILILFFLICIFSIFKYGNSTLLGSLTNPDNDDVKYIRSAWVLADTGNLTNNTSSTATVYMMPGLSFVLAFFVLIFGKFGGITAFRVFQALVQTGSLYLVFLIARKLFNAKVGIIAIIICILSIADYWVANLILTETIFKFVVLCLVYFSIYALEEQKTKYYVWGGVALGLGTLFRPTIATFPIIILLMWILKKYNFKAMLKYTAIVAAVFCLILSPWWVRNYSIFHKFIPLTLASGNPTLQGTFINYDQSSAKTDGLDYSQFKYPAGSEIANNKVEMEISKYRLMNLVPKQPFEFLEWYTVGKAKHQIASPFFWSPEFLGVNYQIANLWHKFTLFFSLLGGILYYLNKKRNKLGTLVIATIIYFIVVYLPFFTMGRYFYPAMPLVTIFTAYGGVTLVSFVYNRLSLNEKLSEPKVK
ncbi:MAG TPA: glycosyltransferase family 39 protein [Desulfosporosinus sp.]|nr:glycosyltransferase family 39 protein [Desulfosporosinus sp.]